MLIAKYDYETDIRVQREEAQEKGRLEGQELKLIEQLKKKLIKGQTSVEIADALEESVEKIEEMIHSLDSD